MTLSPRVGFWMAVLVLVALPARASAQSLRGVVLSEEDRSPIELAQVKLVDLETGKDLVLLTDQFGSFFAERLPGRVNELAISALGKRTHVDTIYALSEEDSVVVEIRLGVEAIPMDPLLVVGSRRPPWESTEPKYLWEFFERKQIFSRLGQGSRFYDRAALDSRIGKIGSVSRLESLWPIQTYRRQLAECRPDFFVDGIRWRGEDPLKEIPWNVDDLAGVEVYYRPGIPAEFVTERRWPCQVMVIWTKKPVFPEDSAGSGPRPIIFASLFAIVIFLIGF